MHNGFIDKYKDAPYSVETTINVVKDLLASPGFEEYFTFDRKPKQVNSFLKDMFLTILTGGEESKEPYWSPKSVQPAYEPYDVPVFSPYGGPYSVQVASPMSPGAHLVHTTRKQHDSSNSNSGKHNNTSSKRLQQPPQSAQDTINTQRGTHYDRPVQLF